LQSDGYDAAYQGVGGPQVVEAACWAHVRRKFFEAARLDAEDPVPARVVARIDELFGLEAEARARGSQREARREWRRRHAPPRLEALRAELEVVRATALPASALGKAAAYALGLWPRLVRFVDHGELELSSNLAENAMRGVALGRKNWIHVGSAEAGPKVAAILSVVETSKRLGLDLRAYLADVLPRLATTSIQRVGELTPSRWAASRGG